VNYFAHALPFLDKPYFVAGTGVPDWLTVVDRQVRVSIKRASPLLQDTCPRTAAVAGGIVQHIRDDMRFHATRTFVETTLELTGHVQPLLGSDAGFRASFVGHLLVEVLLDAELAAAEPHRLEDYYRVLQSLDVQEVQAVVNRMASRPTDRLAPLIQLFCRERILSDYFEDDKLFIRLNQVMRRIGFAQLPRETVALLPLARELVHRRRDELLHDIPVTGTA
jgi:hypothetical protein